VIISDKLYEVEGQQLITVVETHRSVLGYSHQTRRNPSKRTSTSAQQQYERGSEKEVLKLLYARIIYPVPSSEWVSPVQVVPKKGGMIVVRNDKNECIPQRTVTGWRMYIAYRKLNKATKKDHFSLPFIDEMLERLEKHSFFCFLDGYSGYHQIPIHPNDQDKTTFRCPYGTYTYR
jgi:hypothetical protein